MWTAWGQRDRPRALDAVPDDLIGRLFLIGDPKSIAQGVKRYVEAGVTTPMLSVMLPGGDNEATLDGVVQLGEAIRAALAEPA
jgi:alkanesulfonate monooxygenase SsuD/methylene tetrahydromethanopterin reductase-like flavin-dependent oxidoreductase (luciferase family)